MTWGYRIIHYDKDGEGGYGLHEVRYNSKGEVHSRTEKPTTFVSDEGGPGMVKILEMALKDIRDAYILEESDLPEGVPDHD